MRLPGDKLHKLASVLQAPTAREMYAGLASHWPEPEQLVLGANAPGRIVSEAGKPWPDLASEMMYLDSVAYLPDDILVKVDRASMSAGLEVRSPFLDFRLAELAWSLPLKLKIRGGRGKWCLRQLLARYLPPKIWQRPKMGFGIPLDAWLRGPLRTWAEDLLGAENMRREGFLDPAPVQQKWREHLSGRRDRQYQLWDVLMFESWLQARHSDCSVGCASEAPV